MLYVFLDLISFIMKGLITLILCVTVWAHILKEFESVVKDIWNDIKVAIENQK